MVTKLVKNPLGMGVGDGLNIADSTFYQPKLWIGTALGVVGGLASSLLGGAASASAMRAAERRQRAAENAENAWYTRRYNEDYVDTKAGQNLVRRAKEFADKQWKRAAGAKAVAGGTDAAAAMQKEAGNKMVGDTIANIAATDVQRKAHADDAHRQAEEKFAQMDMAREVNRAQNITNAAQAASNAMMTIGSAVDQANMAKTNLTGGDNKGKTINLDTKGVDDAQVYRSGNAMYDGGYVPADELDKARAAIMS